MKEPSRRLPVYLLLDCSGSMAGEPIESVRMGVKALLTDLLSDPQAMETVHLSVITFSESAVQTCPLTELPLFQEPSLIAGGPTSLGAALHLLEECIEVEVRKPTKEQKGDWKPLIFLMTDGVPTDIWEPAAASIRSKRLGTIIACAAGEEADPELLKKLTGGDNGMVVQLKHLVPDEMKLYFKWVSSSVKTSSQAIADGDQGTGLPPLPTGVRVFEDERVEIGLPGASLSGSSLHQAALNGHKNAAEIFLDDRVEDDIRLAETTGLLEGQIDECRNVSFEPEVQRIVSESTDASMKVWEAEAERNEANQSEAQNVEAKRIESETAASEKAPAERKEAERIEADWTEASKAAAKRLSFEEGARKAAEERAKRELETVERIATAMAARGKAAREEAARMRVVSEKASAKGVTESAAHTHPETSAKPPGEARSMDCGTSGRAGKDFGSEHPHISVDLDNVLQLLETTTMADEPTLRRDLAMAEERLGTDHLETAVILAQLARVLYYTGQLAEANALLLRSEAIARRLRSRSPHSTEDRRIPSSQDNVVGRFGLGYTKDLDVGPSGLFDSFSESFRCSAFYPERIDKKMVNKIVACIHLEKVATDVVREAARRLDLPHHSKVKVASAISKTHLPRQSVVDITPDVPGLLFDTAKATLPLWEDQQFAEFRFKPDDSSVGQLCRGWLHFWLEGVILADVSVAIIVESDDVPDIFQEAMAEANARPYRLVFPSYSHDDEQVVERLEAYAESFGDEYLRDVRRLRTGQRWKEELKGFIRRASVFQLFWSERAAQSAYVADEWRCALRERDVRPDPYFLRPVYWREPLAPYPEELREIHFAKVPLIRD